MKNGKGFIAALDQSGGSTPKALERYGVGKDAYSTDAEMFDLVHEMRTRIITSPSFSSEYILAAILFENTMDRQIQGMPTSDYLWEKKGVVPLLKVDKGLDAEKDGVQLMKPMPALDDLLKKALAQNIFGTKMRSVIKKADKKGIHEIVKQQFEIGCQIFDAGLVPILEPEVDIHSEDKAQSEVILREEIEKHLAKLPEGVQFMFKLSIPTEPGFYTEMMKDPHVVRIVALSGGYSREEANALLAKNPGLIASFSRALLEGLDAAQSDEEFNATLAASVKSIYEATAK